MQKKITAILMLTVLLLGLFPTAALAAPASGEWVQTSIDDEKGYDRDMGEELEDPNTQGGIRCVYARASYAFDWNATTTIDDETQSASGRLSAEYKGLPERIPANQPVTISISLASSSNATDAGTEEEEVYFSAGISVTGPLLDPTQGKVNYKIPFFSVGAPFNDSKTWSFGFGESSEGAVAEVTLHLSDPQGLQAMWTTYHYTYVPLKVSPSPQALPTEVELSGLARSVADAPMPWMKLQAWVYYETESYSGAQPDLIIEGMTDHLGRYKLKIPLREEDPKPLGILLVGTLECLNPYENKQTAFFFVDMMDSVSASQKQTNLSTWIKVNPADYIEEAERKQPIRISRLLAFYNLGLGAWSFDDGLMPDPVYYFSTGNQVQTLQDLSYLYTIAYDAWFFGAVTLGEQTALMAQPLCIEARWQSSPPSQDDTSHYTASDNTIRLTEEKSKRDDPSRFTILHEFGHAFDAMTLGNGSFRAGQGVAPGDVNHGGYLNSSSSDSYIEGFATCFAGLAQRYSGYPNPEKLDWIDLTTPSAYVTWRQNGKYEELPIASFLYYLHDVVGNTAGYWALLKPEYNNFKEYFDSFKAALSGSAAQLDDYAFDAGLYTMPFGNGSYDTDEPFSDVNGNGAYDAGEPFVDLMYDVDASGSVDPSKPLRNVDRTAIVYGATSGANQTRSTIKAPVDCDLTLTGTIPEYLLVDIATDAGTTRMLRATAGGRVFLGLPEAPAAGTVTVSVPGGSVIYSGNLAKLQEARDSHVGRPIPLDTADIGKKDLAPAGTQVVATYGDAKADGVMKIPQPSSEALDAAAQDFDLNAPLSQVTSEHGGTPPSGGGTTQGGATSDNSSGGSDDVTPEPDIDQGIFATAYGPVIIIAIAVVVLAAAVLLIVIIVKRDRTRQPPAGPMTGTPQATPQIASGQAHTPPARFCTGCGDPLAPGEHFCTKCGKRMQQ